MNVVWNERKTAEAIERRQRGETLKQIADALGTSTTPVFQALRKAGIPAPPKNYIRWSLDMDEKLMMMREQKMPQRLIAEKIGVDVDTMKRRCKALGI
jgi:DNA-binding Lrp family transcriptional regulator